MISPSPISFHDATCPKCGSLVRSDADRRGILKGLLTSLTEEVARREGFVPISFMDNVLRLLAVDPSAVLLARYSRDLDLECQVIPSSLDDLDPAITVLFADIDFEENELQEFTDFAITGKLASN